jgi:hypothetical protein
MLKRQGRFLTEQYTTGIKQSSSQCIQSPNNILFLCGIMSRLIYAESGAEIHIGFNLMLVTQVFNRF